VGRTKPFIKNNIRKNNTENKIKNVEERKPCGICGREGKGSARYHPESVCWFKNKNQRRTANQLELEVELNEENLKHL